MDGYLCGQCKNRDWRTGVCLCRESRQWRQEVSEIDMACNYFDMDEDCDEYEEYLEEMEE